MTIAMAASEIFPYVKSGGLADAVGGLCKELSHQERVIAILPLYRSIDRKRFDIRPSSISFSLELGKEIFDISVYYTSFDGYDTYFIYHPLLCDENSLYESSGNDVRFGLFAHAVCVMAAEHIRIDVLHLHDWQSALAAPLAKTYYRLSCRVVLSIHNLAFQGVFSKKSIERLNLGWELFTMDQLEFFDQVNFLKGGIAYADAVTTVSPTYAQEIKTAAYGAGLDGFLLRHETKLSGILNGINTVEFDPSCDPSLNHPFDTHRPQNKKHQKEALCRELLLENHGRTLFAYVGRLAEQKGINELVELIHTIQDAPLNIVILGSGDSVYESLCKTLYHYKNVKIVLKYDEELSRRIYGASDFFLMPSRFEPCGLAQMIAMRYGSIPIVRQTGGLKDTVTDFTDIEDSGPSVYAGIGITMEECDVVSFMHAIIKALSLYADEAMMQEFIAYNMEKDFSWHRPALGYLALYRSLNP